MHFVLGAVTIVSVLALPFTVWVLLSQFKRLHQSTLDHMRETATFGGTPVTLQAEKTRLEYQLQEDQLEAQQKQIERLRETSAADLLGN